MQQLETDRLILRPLDDADVDALFVLECNPLVHRYLGNNPLQSKEEVKERLATILNQYVENGIGRMAVIEKSSGAFVGWSGIKLETLETNGYTNYIDVGYRLKPEFWGQGYATESAIAAMKHGFYAMDIQDMFGAAHAKNIASNKALQKVGLNYVEDFEYDNAPHRWYHVNRTQWNVKP